MQVLGFLEKAQLENTATDLTDNVAGLVWLNTASSRVKFYDGAITRTVVDENSTQVLTGKTLSGNTMANFSPDGVENITAPVVSGAMLVDQHELNNMNFLHQTTPASPAAGGIKVYSKNDNQLYKLDSEGNEIAIGTGGGGLDVFHIEDFETNNAADFSTGNNILYLGGGVLAGTLADETIDPISKTRSIKYTQAAGSLNDYFTSPAFDIDPKQAGNYCGFTAYFTYDGDAGDIKFVLYDATNGEVISSILDVVESADNPTRFRLQAFIPEGVTSLRWGVQVVVENVGAILVCDDVEITSDPTRNIKIYASSEWENKGVISVSAISGTNPTKGTTEIDQVLVRRDGDTAHFDYRFKQTTVGTGGNNEYIYKLPDGMEFDPNKVLMSTAAIADIDSEYAAVLSRGTSAIRMNGGISGGSEGYIVPYDSTHFRIMVAYSYSSIQVHGQGFYDYSNSSIEFKAEFSAAIEGWSNTTDATVETDGQKSETVTLEGYAALDSGAIRYTDTITNTASNLIEEVNSNRINFLRDCSFICTGSGRLNASGIISFAWKDKDDNVKIQPQQGSDLRLIGGISGKAEAGDYIQILSTQACTDYTFLSITATPESTNVNIIRPAVQVAYIDVDAGGVTYLGSMAGTTSYKTVNLQSVSGDSSVCSISSNQFTLKKGIYTLDAGIGTANGAWISAQIYNITSSSVAEEFYFVTYSSSLTISFNTISSTIEVTEDTTFELQTKNSAGGTEYASRIKITKLR